MNYLQKITTAGITLLMPFFMILPALSAHDVFASTTQNLISDADLSQVDSSTNQPTGWHTDAWGTNSASFSYSSASQSSTAYLRVDMQEYQDGDAKWWFNPVSVTSGDQYQFTDSYQSNVTTNIWARFLDAQNSPSYVWLGNGTSSVTFSSKSFDFTAPTGSVSVTIFHVINTDGYLSTNNFVLSDITPAACQPSLSNGIYNSSLEETCSNDPSIPAWWNHVIYGSASASFDYLNMGYDGNHSIDIDFTGGSGEAGWYFNSMAVSANQRYRFSFWYDSSIYAYAYVEINLAGGQTQYQPLMSVPSSGNLWSQYQDAFITPAGTQSLTIHIATSAVGTVTLDDFSLQQLTNYASNNLNRGLVSIDFDDDLLSSYQNGLPALNSYGYKGTFYINGGTLGQTSYMTATQVKNLAKQGEEIASHSYYHDNLVSLSLAAATNEVTENSTYLSSITSQQITDFATPYGSYNTPVLNMIMQYHETQRDTSGALNYKYNFNPQIIHSVLITKSTTLANLNSLLSQAKSSGAWLILTYHGVANGGDEYTISKSTLQSQLKAIKSSGLTVVTTQKGYSEIQPQL